MATLVPDGSTGQKELAFIATALANLRHAITTVDEERRTQMTTFTKTHKQGHSKHGPWDSGNEKANVDRLVFITQATDKVAVSQTAGASTGAGTTSQGTELTDTVDSKAARRAVMHCWQPQYWVGFLMQMRTPQRSSGRPKRIRWL